MIAWYWITLIGFIFAFLVVRFVIGFALSLFLKRLQQRMLLHVDAIMEDAKKDVEQNGVIDAESEVKKE